MVNEIVLDKSKMFDFQFQDGFIAGTIWALTGRTENRVIQKHYPDNKYYVVKFESTEQQLIDVIDAINTVFPGVITHKKD